MVQKSGTYSKGIIFLLVSALLYSIMPVLIRFLGAENVPPMSQVFLRYIVAFVSAFAYFKFTKSKIVLQRRDIVFLILLAVFGYALTNLFVTYSILYTEIGNALFIFYCFAIITPILGYFILKEKLNTFNIIAFFLTFLALLLLFRPNSVATWRIGGFFAVLSAVGQSFYLIGRKKLPKYTSQFLLLLSTFVGVLVLGVLSLIFENSFYTSTKGITNLSSSTWLVTILFGIDNFLAWLFMSKGFQYVKSSLGSLLLLSELIFATTFAFLFFTEVPSVNTVIGGMLIITSSTVVILKGDNS